MNPAGWRFLAASNRCLTFLLRNASVRAAGLAGIDAITSDDEPSNSMLIPPRCNLTDRPRANLPRARRRPAQCTGSMIAPTPAALFLLTPGPQAAHSTASARKTQIARLRRFSPPHSTAQAP